MVTTIKLREETKAELDKLREHPNESYDQVVRKVIFITKTAKKQPELSQETIKRIEEARKRMEKGEFITHDELKKKLGL
jgi:predicted transcriptional regulator